MLCNCRYVFFLAAFFSIGLISDLWYKRRYHLEQVIYFEIHNLSKKYPNLYSVAVKMCWDRIDIPVVARHI